MAFISCKKKTDFIRKINDLIYSFVWKGKDKVKRHALINSIKRRFKNAQYWINDRSAKNIVSEEIFGFLPSQLEISPRLLPQERRRQIFVPMQF